METLILIFSILFITSLVIYGVGTIIKKRQIRKTSEESTTIFMIMFTSTLMSIVSGISLWITFGQYFQQH